MVSSASKRVLIIAGPNGAGKTTFAQSFLSQEPQCQQFINADLIAAGLSPFAPEKAAIQAGRIMLKTFYSCENRGESFSVETTLSALNYVEHIRRWKAGGYRVGLFFLTLPSPETAIARVAQRVLQGGHNIPESTIRRRYIAGLRNFDLHYKACVDEWVKLDNTGSEPVLSEFGKNT